MSQTSQTSHSSAMIPGHRDHRLRCRRALQIIGALVAMTICGGLSPSQRIGVIGVIGGIGGIGDASAQQAGNAAGRPGTPNTPGTPDTPGTPNTPNTPNTPGTAQRGAASDDTRVLEFRLAPPKDGDEPLFVRIEVEQPYIDRIATRVTYDGWDRVFGIEWRVGQRSGRLQVPDAMVIQDLVFADILDRTNAGVSVPERYTPYTAPRLLPYLLAVRDQWGQQFNDTAHAGAGMATVALMMSIRPTTSPLAAPAARSAAAARGQSTPTASAPSAPSVPAVPAPAPAGAAAKPGSVWSRAPAPRGRAIEKALGGNLIDNFPVIDKFENGIATSIKSLDLGAKSYQNTRTLTSTVTRYINKVAGFKGARWARREIAEAQVQGRALELAVPTAGTAAQQAALKKLVEYGHSRGVDVTIIVFP